ncbi:MAG: hypothetical protein ICV68_14875, partial [Pyrinomonadaceae bacterium]|nr:hypothetical protein [Pyrinomonadaceae bacterium]
MSDSYLQNAFRADKEQVVAVRRLIGEVSGVFPAFFEYEEGFRASRRKFEVGNWPYKVIAKDSPQEEHEATAGAGYSFSTNAMIMFSLATAAGLLRESALVPTRTTQRDSVWSFEEKEDGRDVFTVLQAGLRRFVKESKEVRTGTYDPLVTSGSFGNDDPFTLTWIASVSRAVARIASSSAGDLEEQVKSYYEGPLSHKVVERLTIIERDVRENPHQYGRHVLLLPKAGTRDRKSPAPHVFPLLRVAHLALEMYGFGSNNLDGTAFLPDGVDASYNLSVVKPELARTLQQIFRDCVYLQLSYQEIPDSDFDVGELVFALEGLLLTDDDVEISLVTT